MISSIENRILDVWVGNRNIDEMMGILKDYRICVWSQGHGRVFLFL